MRDLAGRRLSDPGWSVAARLSAWYAGSSLGLLLVLSRVLDWTLSASLESEITQIAERERTEIGEILRESPGNLGELREEVVRNQESGADTRIWVRMVDLTGAGRDIESRGMTQLAVKRDSFPLPVDPNTAWGRGQHLDLPEEHARAFSALMSPSPQSSDRWMIQIAVDAMPTERVQTKYHSRATRLLLLAFAGFALVGHAIARNGLKPLRRIAREMDTIRSTTLDRRLPLQDLPAEVSVLATAFNEVLDRLDDAFLRLARSSADIAHELRTPLARMRLAAEVALQKSATPDLYKEALGSCLEEAVELSALIDRVLFLARSDGPESLTASIPIDVAAELERLRDLYEAAAAERGITITTSCQPVTVRGDRGLILRAIGNLIDNALVYTTPGGCIELKAFREADCVSIAVCDNGCGIPAEHLSSVFDAFNRVDRARSTDSGGAGLGLAIVKKVATLHGGTATIASTVGAGTTVTLSLPTA